MRVIKFLFIVASMVAGTCIGQENEQQDYPITSIENLFANPAKYDGKNISIVGILDLSHFEDGNGGVLMHGYRLQCDAGMYTHCVYK